jgi:ATP-dependent DNA helicase RecG
LLLRRNNIFVENLNHGFNGFHRFHGVENGFWLNSSGVISLKKIIPTEKSTYNFVENKLTNAAVLLFGKKPQKFLTNSEVRVGRFKNQIDIIDTILIDGNLFQQLQKTTESIKKHLNVKFEISDNQRQDIWDYPIPAIREAIMNALIHRDYLVSGDIQIRVYEDSIWFYNTGLLPYPMTIDKIKLEHGSFP